MDPSLKLNDSKTRPNVFARKTLQLPKGPPSTQDAPRGQKRSAEDAFKPSSRLMLSSKGHHHSDRAPEDPLYILRSGLPTNKTEFFHPKSETTLKAVRFYTLSEDRSSGERQRLLFAIHDRKAGCVMERTHSSLTLSKSGRVKADSTTAIRTSFFDQGTDPYPQVFTQQQLSLLRNQIQAFKMLSKNMPLPSGLQEKVFPR